MRKTPLILAGLLTVALFAAPAIARNGADNAAGDVRQEDKGAPGDVRQEDKNQPGDVRQEDKNQPGDVRREDRHR